MFELFDRVFDKVAGRSCFVIDVDDHGESGIVYGVEAEDQSVEDWFRWSDESDLVKIPEHGDVDLRKIP